MEKREFPIGLRILRALYYAKNLATSFLIFILSSSVLSAQTLEGRVWTAIQNLITIVNILLVGAVAWAGFILARGEKEGINRLIYAVIGLVVVNSSRLIIEFFAP